MPLTGTYHLTDTSHDSNRLIDGLPSTERDCVMIHCDQVELAPGTVLSQAGEPFEHVYFPITGSISLVKAIVGHEPFETESIGSEGVLGADLILDVNRASQRGIVQTPCLALQITAEEMRSILPELPVLSRILKRYLYILLVELTQTTGCIRFHDVGKRLARELLQAHDRVHTPYLPLTHQHLANMLGVQREAVTLAAIKLQRENIIRYSRGKIFILDRDKLEASSCRCYADSIKNYASIFSELPIQNDNFRRISRNA